MLFHTVIRIGSNPLEEMDTDTIAAGEGVGDLFTPNLNPSLKLENSEVKEESIVPDIKDEDDPMNQHQSNCNYPETFHPTTQEFR